MEPQFMKCYQVSQNGEAVALVASIALARRIIQCQPLGFYQVEAVEVGEPMSRPRSRARRSSSKQKTRRDRQKAHDEPGAGIRISLG